MIKQKYKNVVVLEEIKWRQKAKVKWLKEGDNNTKFFHRMTTARRNVNYISKMKIGNAWVEDKGRIKDHVDGFFKELYNDSGIVRPKLEGLEFKMLSDKQRAWLERPITEVEVKNVIWSTEDDKNPGPDVFTMAFYKTYWELIREDVMKTMEFFYYGSSLDRGGSATFISLIPKKGAEEKGL